MTQNFWALALVLGFLRSGADADETLGTWGQSFISTPINLTTIPHPPRSRSPEMLFLCLHGSTPFPPATASQRTAPATVKKWWHQFCGWLTFQCPVVTSRKQLVLFSHHLSLQTSLNLSLKYRSMGGEPWEALIKNFLPSKPTVQGFLARCQVCMCVCDSLSLYQIFSIQAATLRTAFIFIQVLLISNSLKLTLDSILSVFVPGIYYMHSKCLLTGQTEPTST